MAGEEEDLQEIELALNAPGKKKKEKKGKQREEDPEGDGAEGEGGEQGGSGGGASASVGYQGGRFLLGQGMDPKREIWGDPEPEDRFGPPEIVDTAELIALAEEMGFVSDAFGKKGPDGDPEPREATDAEAVYLQIPPVIPFAVGVNLKGGGAFSIFWTDLYRVLHPGKADGRRMSEKDRLEERRSRLEAYTRVINAAKLGTLDKLIGEPCGLVFTGKNFQGEPFSVHIDPRTLGPLHYSSPRIFVVDPLVVQNRKKKHREILGFGVASICYFHSMVLMGGMSAEPYDPVKIQFKKEAQK